MIIRPFLAATIACSLGACTQETDDASIDIVQPSDAADTFHKHHMATVKPGANVQFQTQLRETLSPGDAGALEITIIEGHRSGQMRVTASTSDGIELFTTEDETTIDLGDSDTHEWTVYFDTEEAGKFYVNLNARVETPIGAFTRSHAVPIVVGSPEQKSDTGRSETVTQDGDLVIMMDAVETISQ
ncbi:MAG: hypothetical protein AAF950_08980 [Pseudomonadota bacterium]